MIKFRRKPRVPNSANRPLPDGNKLSMVLELQRICSLFKVRFEQARLFETNHDFRISDFKGAERLLVRTALSRRGYTVKSVSEDDLKKVEAEIKKFTAQQKFLVQNVGLREDIESHGSILIQNLGESEFEIQFSETAYNKPVHEKGDDDAFLPDLNSYTTLKGKTHRFGRKEKNFINQKLQNHRMHLLLEHILGRLEPNGFRFINFVRYKKKGPYFYSMV